MINDAVDIMRSILQIQSTMNMKFRRIIYFLPERGELNRSNALLETELATMANYFGRSVFDSMVVVATMPADVYKYAPDCKLSDDSMTKTRKYFDIALSRALSKEKNLPKPPIVFISMMDSCETIYRNIDEAPVACDGIRLEFESVVCARCGIIEQTINSERVAAYISGPVSGTIPYDESTCHPLLVPKYTKVVRFFGGVAHLITLKKFLGKWPTFSTLDEVCIGCRQAPGSRGCTKVNTKYKIKDQEVIVMHTNNTNEPVTLLSDDEEDFLPEQGQPISVRQTISYRGPAQDTSNVSSSAPDTQDVTGSYEDRKG